MEYFYYQHAAADYQEAGRAPMTMAAREEEDSCRRRRAAAAAASIPDIARSAGGSADCWTASPSAQQAHDFPLLSKQWRRAILVNSDFFRTADRSNMMEAVHKIDVSWVHKPHRTPSNKDQDSRKPNNATPNSQARKTPPPPQSSTADDTAPLPSPPPVHHAGKQSYFPGSVTPPALSEPVKDTTTALPTTPSTPSSNAKTSKRPGLLNRNSSEKVSGDGKTIARRSSWISNISNKFSSSTPPPAGRASPGPPQGAFTQDGASPLPNGHTGTTGTGEEAEPYVPSKPKEGTSFFSNLTRKLSAGQTPTTPKVNGNGGMCKRRVLNVDPNRERCLVPGMDSSKLRKVSFCVDVEIAGGPRYRDDDDDEERKANKKDIKMKEKAEGEALKHPEAIKEEKDERGEVKLEGKNKPLPIPRDIPGADNLPGREEDAAASPPVGSLDEPSAADRKREKKKKSEEERKERKEKRRRRAEENGSIPVELSLDADVATTMDSDTIASTTFVTQNGAAPSPIDKRARPTTDPVRIYRRCCQLRETPILKRITEQLMAPTCCAPFEPGVVSCLNLTGSRLQLADMVTLGDWLAVVPVKRLLLEDADVSDEGLRCILAGLLAAKRPEPTRRKGTSPKHREGVPTKPYRERAGVVEKLTLKNNPRITRTGWKHISLFLYMCRSIKAIDLSMIFFPDTLPPSANPTAAKGSPNGSAPNAQECDAAEIFFKCLSQRVAGDKLEELIMSECGLIASQIRKIVDGAIICGINRLGFAGTHLDEEGLDAVLHYLKSGVSGGLDIGGNDLRGKLGLIADALNSRSGVTCWGLSLAGCNLDTASVKVLFPTLAKLPNFRFIDLSHNPDLCGQDNGTISLLRRYIGQMKYLKRIHLADVGMSPKQAIALADVLPEGPQLAHLSILENPQLSALANAKDEASQEEACALYASYMAAVRVSNTLICIDIDVPSADNSEVVKALAKQVVAYSLRNMERFAIAEATGADSAAAADAAASLTEPYGGVQQQLKEIAVPDVLMHLVGHVEGSSENHDNDDPAPDDDYIVGGTGVVKALQYVLGEKADDLRRGSLPGSPISGPRTHRDRPSSSAGFEEQQQVKAKKMSKNLLDSARKIRARLQPALAKEANTGDEMAYRRLLFLDQTLQSMIQRFEEEYPECRLAPASPRQTPSLSSSATEISAPLTINTNPTEISRNSDDEEEFYDDDNPFRPAVSRHNSDVSLASRALALEEGHLHRLGQRMRREVVDSPAVEVADDKAPWKLDEAARLEGLKEKIEAISGPELKALVERSGWDAALRKVGANMNDLREIQSQDPQAWDDFLESQMKARMNVAQDARR